MSLGIGLEKLLSTGISLTSTLSDLVLISPDEKIGYVPNDQNMDSGFLFHVIGDEKVELTSDITDHYVEDNTAIQDHVALRPEKFVVSGFIGELNNVTPKELEPVKAVVDRLTAIDAYIPSLTATAYRAYNLASQTYAAFQKAKLAIKRLTRSEKYPSKQAEAFSRLIEYWRDRTLFTVQTPYCLMTNMAIESVTAIQADGNKMISDIEITFKKMRFADVILTEKKTSSKVSRNQKQVSRQSVKA